MGKTVKNSRTIIVGDIHGCFRTLRALLKEVEYDEAADRIIFVGDYIDRGPRIRETSEYLMDLKERAGDLAVMLRGNHEQMMLDGDTRLWYMNGGDETDRQLFGGCTEEERAELLRWFRELPLEWRGEGFSVTHAGAKKGVDADDAFTKVWNRDLKSYRGPLVICGHTPVWAPVFGAKGVLRKLSYHRSYRLPPEGLLDLDTGCVFGYELSAMVIEGKNFYLTEVKNQEKG